ncbi:MAG TPA: hypothetical protein VGG75_38510 [Trebonia sp.]|jgi:hypothetical protein
MAASWGPVERPAGRGGRPIGAEGTVTQPSEGSLGAGPHHEVRYDATDGRHGRESGMHPWESVDPMSGPTANTDFGQSAGRFPDGPGAWRQT